MAYETSTKDSLVAIRDKLQEIIQDDGGLSDIVKVYKGAPNSIPKYPAVMLDYTEDIVTQASKGRDNLRQKHSMSVIVLHKYLNYDERQDKLLTYTGKIKKLLITNRYLSGLRANDGSWKVLGLEITGTIYEPLIKPNTFVLNSSEIKIEITTEGI